MPVSRKKKINAYVDWCGFKGDQIILPACVRSPSVRGRNFEATVKEVAKRVPHTIIMLCDTLDTHNYKGRVFSPQRAAIQNANIWWQKVEPIIAENFISYELKRWQDVQKDPTYNARLDLIHRLYHEDQDFQDIVCGFATWHNLEQKSRMSQNDKVYDMQQEMRRSIDYLLDEIAGDTVYADWYPGIPEAYHGSYFADINLFNKVNTLAPHIDLTIPKTLPVHINRLSPPTIIEEFKDYARGAQESAENILRTRKFG